MTLNVLLVCHAGPAIGLGHLKRTIVVARTLQKELGAEILILIEGMEFPVENLYGISFKFIEPQHSLVQGIYDLSFQNKIQLVVFDLHPKFIPKDMDKLLVQLRIKGCKLVAIDSMASYSKLLELVFIPSFQYRDLAIEEDLKKFVFGWDCFLLSVSQSPQSWAPGKNVLVLSGGSDATGLGKNFPYALNGSLDDDVDLHWITGPFSQAPIWPNKPRINMHNHFAPTELDAFMLNANYAITVYGVSFYELLYYGVPTVVFSPYGNKDSGELQAISAHGIALVALNEYDAILKLKYLMANHELAASYSLKAKNKMMKKGDSRFADCISLLVQV